MTRLVMEGAGQERASCQSDMKGPVLLTNYSGQRLEIDGQFLLDFISEWANYRIVKLEPREDGTSRL